MVSRRRVLILIVLVAVAVAAIPATLIYAKLISGEPNESGLYFKAIRLHKKPDNYWNLTDPDEFVLEAIQNPGDWVRANETTETYTRQIFEHNRSDNVCYEGAYYHIEAIDVDPPWLTLTKPPEP